MRRTMFLGALLVAVVPLLVLPVGGGAGPRGAVAQAAELPPDFSDVRVAALGAPTAVAQLPDGRLLVTTQVGLLRVVRPDGQVVDPPALDLRGAVCADFERGLLGVEVDPDVTSNGYVYLSYTSRRDADCPRNRAGAPVNRVSRFTLSGDGVVAGSERVLIDGVPSPAGNHNGGDVAVGPDGMLYASFGDGGCSVLDASRCAGANDVARRRDYPLGKVLRVTRDGDVPSDNPWSGEAGAVQCTRPGAVRLGDGPCAETWLWGLRNPFRFAFEASSGQMFVNDVGQNANEEVDRAVAGADYGWNIREGACPTGTSTPSRCGPSSFEDPIVSYPHSSGCRSITGGAFAPSTWPAPYDGAYLYADYVCGRIFARPAAGGEATTLVSGLGSSSAVHLEMGRWAGRSALLYTTYEDGGEVRALTPDGAGSQEEPPGEEPSEPSEPSTGDEGLAATATPGGPYAAGDDLTVHVRSTEQGVADPKGDEVRWTVRLHHDEHTHPFASGDGATLTLRYPEPEDLRAAETSFVTAEATVNDDGQTRTSTLRLLPAAQDVMLASFPSGLSVQVAGEQVTLPAIVTGWTGWSPALDVAAQTVDGRRVAPVRSTCGSGGESFRMTVGPAPTTCFVTTRSRVLAYG